MNPYGCGCCSFTAKEFHDVINHCVEEHSSEKIILRKIKLCPLSGKEKHVLKDYKLIPSDLRQKNLKVVAGDEEKLRIIKHSRTATTVSESVESKDSLHASEENDDDEDSLRTLTALLPKVVTELQNEGLLETYVKFNKLISERKFPLDNIAFLLFMDVVKFLSCGTTNQMRYNKTVKSFWLTGYKLFHSKFLRLMGGPKHQGLRNETLPDILDPSKAKINFIVPHIQTLEAMSKSIMQEDLKPGILTHVMDLVQNHYGEEAGSSMKICFDGKRINACLTENEGDIDLFGCEEKPTLQEQHLRNEKEKEQIETLLKRAQDILDSSELQNLKISPSVLLPQIKGVMETVSIRVSEMRQLTVSKELAVTKFKTLGLPDWRLSKYKFVISAIQTSLYQMKECIDNCLQAIDQLGRVCAELQGTAHLYSVGETVDMSHQENYVCIQGESFVTKSTNSSIEHHLLKQRSEQWFNLRKQCKVSGSTVFKALGLDSLKEQISHFDYVFNKLPRKQPDSQTQLLLDHGTLHELDAVATTCGKILPIFYPRISFVEEGCYDLRYENNSFCVVSPDGSGRTSPSHSATIAFEIKCPHPDKKFSTQQMYKIPVYYSTQLLCEMAALQCEELLFICYTEVSSTVFKVSFSQKVLDTIWNALLLLYGSDNPQRPKKRPDNRNTIRQLLQEFLETNVTFICEVLSVKAVQCVHEKVPSSPAYSFPITPISGRKPSTVLSIPQALHKSLSCVKEAAQLTRKMATEVFVFLISDLDRIKNNVVPHALPIAYGMQGTSLRTAVVRRMFKKVLTECLARGINVKTFSCDGQFIGLIHRDDHDKALTQLQLQKQYWEKVLKIPKSKILKYIEGFNVTRETENRDSNDRMGTQMPFLMQTRHLRALHHSKNTGCDTKRPNTDDDTEKAMNLLPLNLKDLVDSETYSEVVTAMKTLIQDKEQAKDSGDCDEDEDGFLDSATDALEDSIIVPEQRASTVELQNTHIACILSALKSDDTSKKQKWNTMSYEEFSSLLTSAKTIHEAFTSCQLKIVLRVLKQLFKEQAKHIQISANKATLVNFCSDILADGSKVQCKKRIMKRQVPSLKSLSNKSVRKLPAKLLRMVYAESLYPDILREWRTSFPFASECVINNEDSVTWFSYPETLQAGSQQRALFGVVDSHHILTNLRAKCCSTGMPKSGITQEAWLRVAKSSKDNGTGLSLAQVQDLIDRQSNAFARKTFSEEVEDCMRNYGNENEANLCRLIREWYEADDEPGLSSSIRTKRRLALRKWLLSKYDGLIFPPPGMYVKDIPIVTYEALLTNIERKIQLHPYVGGSYNPRAVSTLDAENFFSLFDDLHPSAGTRLKPENVKSCLRTACQLMSIRLDMDRSFHMCTSRAPVYPQHGLHQVSETDKTESTTEDTTETIHLMKADHIITKDHEFDLTCERKRKRKRKSGEVSKPTKYSRGARGIREFHKRDESKILPHIRLGIDLPE